MEDFKTQSFFDSMVSPRFKVLENNRGVIKNRNEIVLYDYRDTNQFLYLYPKIKLFGLSSSEYFHFKHLNIKHSKTKDNMIILNLNHEFFELKGKKYETMRYRKRYFTQKIQIDIRKQFNSKSEVIELIRKWKELRKDNYFQLFIGQDINYFERYYDKRPENIISRFFYHNDELVGYAIIEKLNDGYYQYLIRKVNTNYKALCLFVDYSMFDLIYNETQKHFIMNFGNCSGSKGLLKYKTMFFPVAKMIPFYNVRILTKTSNPKTSMYSNTNK